MNKILFAVRVGEPDYAEHLITEVAARIPAASKWALANGFDRLRVAEIDDGPPDFTKVLNAAHLNVPTVTLRDGTVVLAKLYKGELCAVTYSNRTQAFTKETELGEAWTVQRRGRPFYVVQRASLRKSRVV
jgi:hypothetical protein